MITSEGPKVLEFNARFGDPETQVVLPRLKSDLLDTILAVINGSLDRIKIEWSEEACVGVVMASGGYPGSYKTGYPISGLESLDKDVLVFHAGTKSVKSGGGSKIVTNGGRVLGVTGLGNTIKDAIQKTYQAVDKIKFEGMHFRKDIGQKAL